MSDPFEHDCYGGCGKKVYLNPAYQWEKEAYYCINCAYSRRASKCTCGAAKVPSPWHSDWCDRYGFDVEQHPRKLSREEKKDVTENKQPDFWFSL